MGIYIDYRRSIAISVEKTVFQKTWTLAKALLTGETVSDERLQKRLEICSKCPKVRINTRGKMKCGICGCRIRGDRALINLARFEETADYGCKYSAGSRWKAQGV